MQLTKEELVKFRAWRNERRKFWAQILVWVVWGGTSLLLFVVLGDLIPQEALSEWMLYASVSVFCFIIAGTVHGIGSTIRRAKKGKDDKTQDRQGSEEEEEIGRGTHRASDAGLTHSGMPCPHPKDPSRSFLNRRCPISVSWLCGNIGGKRRRGKELKMAKVKIRMRARLLVNCPEIGDKEKLARDCEDCPKNKGIDTKSQEVECDHPKSEAKGGNDGRQRDQDKD